MAFLDELKKITRPYDEDEDFFMEDEEQEEFPYFSEDNSRAPAEYEEPAPAPSKSVFSKRDREPVRPAAAPTVERGKMKLVLANPSVFEEAAEIADNLRDKQAVLMNIEHASKDVQRRLIDFLSGVAYALGGKIKRVSAQAYILTPTSIDLVGDAVDDFESSGFYF